MNVSKLRVMPSIMTIDSAFARARSRPDGSSSSAWGMTFTTNALTEASATRAAAAPSTRDHLNRHFLAQQLDAAPHDGEDLEVAMRERPERQARDPETPPCAHIRAISPGSTSAAAATLGERQAAAVAPQRDRDASTGSSPGLAARSSSTVAPRPTR